MVDGPAQTSQGLTRPKPVVVAETPIVRAEPTLELAPPSEPEIVPASEPSLLNDRERNRMDTVMAGLSQFRPVADLQRPAPRAEVDPLSSVSAADWSGMDGMGESIAMPASPEPVLNTSRRESAPAPSFTPAPEPATVASAVAEPIPTTDPARGWVTADRLFSDFGD